MLLIPTLGLMVRAEEIMELLVKIVTGEKTVILSHSSKTSTRQSFAVIQTGDCQHGKS